MTARTPLTYGGTPPSDQRVNKLVESLKSTAKEHLDDAYRRGWDDALHEFEMMLNSRAQRTYAKRLYDLRKRGRTQ